MTLRVLTVLPWIASGGVERRRAMLSELASDDFEHLIVSFTADGELERRIRAGKAKLKAVGGKQITSLNSWRDVALEIDRFRPHIIHGAVFEGNILAAILGTLLHVPIVILEETSEATNRSSRGHKLLRMLTRLADRIVAISEPVARDLERVTKVPVSKISLITNGVEPYEVPSKEARAQARARFGFLNQELVVGTMCRLVDDSHKRVSDMIRAMALPQLDSIAVRLLVCGDGKVRQELETLSAELGVSERVVFAGTLIDPRDGFYAMDIFAHVAAREGFGLAVAEAAFCALPIVTTGVGGIAEIVVPDETALIVPVGDPEKIADAILALATDPEKRLQMGEAGRERALARFSAQRWVNDLESLYRELLREKGLI